MHKSRLSLLFLGVVMLLGIPLTVVLLQQQQEVRQRASELTPTPMSCPAIATDTLLILDASGSMSGKASSSDTNTKFVAAKTAAKTFVSAFPSGSIAYMGLVRFFSTQITNTTPVERTLTNDLPTVISAIDLAKIEQPGEPGGTCIECAIIKASNEFAARGRPNVKKIMVLLTDGIANATMTKVYNSGVTQQEAEQAAITAATNAFNTHKVVIYPIGLGTDVNAGFLQQIATITGGKYYFAPSSTTLTSVYQEISRITARGSIQGIIYNDLNGNGIKDSAESVLNGWTLQAKNSSEAIIAATTSDQNGTYTLTGLCDGTYTAKPVLQSGWTQTQPTGNAPHTVIITNAAAVDNKNFGVAIMPTNTPTLTPTLTPTKTPSPTPSPTPFAPGVNFSANPTSVPYNGSSTLQWTTTDALSCTASGGWTGNKETLGNEGVNNLQTTQTYTLTCTGPGGSTTKSVTVTVGAPPTNTPVPPSLTFAANPTEIPYNGSTTLTWSSTNTTSCTASNGWTGTKGTTGTETKAQLTGTNTFVLTCTGPGGTQTKSVTVVSGLPPTPTMTPIPAETLLNMNIFLHSIGKSGDNRNPTAYDFSNQSPTHPERQVKVSIYDSTNALVVEKLGSVLYSSASGSFKGSIPIGSQFNNGNYIVAVKTDRYLRNLFSGIQTIKKGEDNTMPDVTLVAGDTNGDNKLDILDYNELLGCYTSEADPTPSNCPNGKNLLTDLNDDAVVNRYDYNLFLRELSVQSGY